MDIKPLNIYQRMAQVTLNIEKVKKNLSVTMGKGSYKAVGEGDVLSAVKPLEAEFGIYSYPSHRSVIDAQILVNEYDKRSQFVRIETTYRFVNIDNPSEFVEITTYGDGVDPQDKAPGKAMTYADKYALLKAYKIETGDDPDAKGSEEMKSATKVKSLATENQIAILVQAFGAQPDRKAQMIAHYNVDRIEALTMEQASEAITVLGKTKK